MHLNYYGNNYISIIVWTGASRVVDGRLAPRMILTCLHLGDFGGINTNIHTQTFLHMPTGM